ncbi:transcriptional regulator, AraC family [Marinactinospora thermotolerans DSM 45154]|uniref:Transcriptional regulator, AraC family n=1 Tax=Marinactinospora thermotolerans DSM 45154 TaxID=1122192 RepID=A0A1T4T2K9_9ACTN|nr:helix-turn-helix transcriptional regulator [Marinactinospora thermotolerans]SKA34686.1 transcriptional regulator, AraC family [Marinactinospora thermotolerans DSM 45154]
MYRERASRLSEVVAWQGRAPDDGSTPTVLPDGCTDLIWNDGGLLVAGPDTGAHPAQGRPGSRYVGLRFPPGMGPVVFGVAARELRDLRVPLADLWPRAEVERLTEATAGAADPLAALEGIAAGRLRRNGPVDPSLRAVARHLALGRTVTATAEAVGLGQRSLHRRCLEAFGYGPKTLARILRMNRALDAARAGVPLGEVAATAGYADQPHMSREVRALTGRSIGRLVGGRAGGSAHPSGSGA